MARRLRVAVGQGQGPPIGIEKITGATGQRSRFTAIQRLQVAPLRVPVEQKSASAQPGALGLHHRQNRLSCHQRIHGMPPGPQHRQGCSAGLGVGGHHHSRAGGGGDAAGSA